MSLGLTDHYINDYHIPNKNSGETVKDNIYFQFM